MSMADRANLKMWRHSSSLCVYKMLHSHSITPWVRAKVLEAGPSTRLLTRSSRPGPTRTGVLATTTSPPSSALLSLGKRKRWPSAQGERHSSYSHSRAVTPPCEVCASAGKQLAPHSVSPQLPFNRLQATEGQNQSPYFS